VRAYVVFQVDVTDAERYERYKERAQASVAAAGGRYVARGGQVIALEGNPPAGRVVVLEFPTLDAAVAWYEGDAYADARALRNRAAVAQVFAVEGCA
jgi:uncharacterized protein (DUF1330 family)